MANARRTDSASRLINASPQTIYRAFVDPEAWVKWLPPSGMTGRMLAFDLREGGSYRMALTYVRLDPGMRGKTSADMDVAEGRFLEVVENERMVHLVTFESGDPVFAGEMTMTWALSSVSGGTMASIICENVPPRIGQEAHDAGLKSTLDNLAAFVERASP